jgi:putative transposase
MRGKAAQRTVGNPAAPCPRDKMNRQVQAPRPNAWRVSDFTCVAPWQGFV